MSALSDEAPESIGDAIRYAEEKFGQNRDLVKRGSIAVEAELLLLWAFLHVTGVKVNRVELYLKIKDLLPEGVGSHFQLAVKKRLQGIPIQYITGQQVFVDHLYEVNSDVLIPRQETEILFALAREEVREMLRTFGREYAGHGIEVGVGSGILSIELLSSFRGEYPRFKMMASDVSEGALKVAKRNAEKILGTSEGSSKEVVEKIEWIKVSDPKQVIEPFERTPQFGALFLISNPPYLVLENASHETDADVFQFEPKVALFSPVEDPLYFYRKIAEGARKVLAPEGKVFLEIPHERAKEIESLFRDLSWDVRVHPDLSQRPRVLIASGSRSLSS